MRSGSMCAGVLGRLWEADVGANAVETACTGGGPEIGGGGTAGHVEQRGGVGEERALKMLFMSVTLDVSNFSGWSNDLAPCMVKGRREAITRD